MFDCGRTVTIGGRRIDDTTAPYLIAEIGVNHEGSLDRARRMIDQAAEGGADAAKFQAYKAEKLAVRDSPAYWDTDQEPTESQYRLFQKYDDFGPEEYRALADHCEQRGIDFLTTPFDREAVDFLAPLVPCYKVASADLTNMPLLERVGSKGKPVLLSTGASTLAEIDDAVRTLDEAGAPATAILHCVLSYPTQPEDAHLGMIRGLRRTYPERVVGYSDHTLPHGDLLSLIVAYLTGARVIEKHFTDDKSGPGNDHYHSMDAEDLRRFRKKLEVVRELVGETSRKEPIAAERAARENARRSIVTRRAVSRGEELTETNLTCKRPGTGVSPRFWREVIGKRAARDLDPDRPLAWGDVTEADV